METTDYWDLIVHRIAIASLAFLASTVFSIAHADRDAIANFEQQQPTLPVWQPEGGEEISFIVRRNGSRFGRHEVSFEKTESGDLKVNNDILLRVKIGPFTAYNYEHESQEIWQDGRLVSLTGETRKERNDLEVDASFRDEELIVEGTRYEGAVPNNIIPSSHWNVQEVYSSAILSSEAGQILPIEVINRGRETITVAGQDIAATKYTLKSELDVDLWYDDQGRWIKCAFEARGQEIVYELQSLY